MSTHTIIEEVDGSQIWRIRCNHCSYERTIPNFNSTMKNKKKSNRVMMWKHQKNLIQCAPCPLVTFPPTAPSSTSAPSSSSTSSSSTPVFHQKEDFSLHSDFLDRDECNAIIDAIREIDQPRSRSRWLQIDQAQMIDVTSLLERFELQKKLQNFFGVSKTFRLMCILNRPGAAPQAPHADFLSSKGYLLTIHLKTQRGTEIMENFLRPIPDPTTSEVTIPLIGDWKNCAEAKFYPLLIRAPDEWDSLLRPISVQAGSLQVIRSDVIHRGPGALESDERLLLFSEFWPTVPDPLADADSSWTPWNCAFQLYGLEHPTYYSVATSWIDRAPCSYLPTDLVEQGVKKLKAYLASRAAHPLLRASQKRQRSQ